MDIEVELLGCTTRRKYGHFRSFS